MSSEAYQLFFVVTLSIFYFQYHDGKRDEKAKEEIIEYVDSVAAADTVGMLNRQQLVLPELEQPKLFHDQ